MCTLTLLLPTGAVWTQLPVGSGRIRTAAVVLRASSREAALYFQPNFSPVMGLAGEQGILLPHCPSQTSGIAVLCKNGGSMPVCWVGSRIIVRRSFSVYRRQPQNGLVYLVPFLFNFCFAVYPFRRCLPSPLVAPLLLSSMDSCLFLWHRFMRCLWWT